eukprot:scaffold156068_cov22-Prasinocladus_malaysianus.AAC.1
MQRSETVQTITHKMAKLLRQTHTQMQGDGSGNGINYRQRTKQEHGYFPVRHCNTLGIDTLT